MLSTRNSLLLTNVEFKRKKSTIKCVERPAVYTSSSPLMHEWLRWMTPAACNVSKQHTRSTVLIRGQFRSASTSFNLITTYQTFPFSVNHCGWGPVDVFSTGWWQEGHPVSKSLHKLSLMERTFPPLRFLHQHHISRLRWTWWMGWCHTACMERKIWGENGNKRVCTVKHLIFTCT